MEVDESRRFLLWRALLSAEGESGRVVALREALDVPRRIFRRLHIDQVLSLLDAAPWLEAKPNPTPTFPYFDHYGTRYYLPASHGLNLVALEYPIADDAFNNYMKTGEEQHLRLLCGTLCREEEADPEVVTLRGDRRVSLLSRSQAEARAERLMGAPQEALTGVLLFFAGVKEYVHRAYGKTLFEEPDTDAAGNPVTNSTRPTLGWWSVYWTVAHDGPFGDVDRVHQTAFHDVCLYLVDRIKSQEEQAVRMKLAEKGFGE